MHDTEFRARSRRSTVASRPPNRRRPAAIRCRARCTTTTRTRWAAWPATRGCSASASDLAIFAQMLLNGGTYNGVRIVADSTVKLFTTRAPPATPRARLGHLRRRRRVRAVPGAAAPTGTRDSPGRPSGSIPTAQMFVILLTNRVHDPKVRSSRRSLPTCAPTSPTPRRWPCRTIPTRRSRCPPVGAPIARWDGTGRRGAQATRRGMRKSPRSGSRRDRRGRAAADHGFSAPARRPASRSIRECCDA